MGLSLDIVTDISKSPWTVIILLILAVAAIVIAGVSYYRGKKVRAPRYMTSSTNFFADLPTRFQKLQVAYAGHPIINLTTTNVMFWNAGRESIKPADIPSDAPIRIKAGTGCEILDSEITFQKEPANKFHLTTTPDRSFVGIGFEYIDHDEGIMLQVIHTGKTGFDITVDGKVIGAGPVVRVEKPQRIRSAKERQRLLIGGIVSIVSGLLAFPIFSSIPPTITITPASQSQSNPAAAGFLVLVFLVALGTFYIYRGIKGFPTGFESFGRSV